MSARCDRDKTWPNIMRWIYAKYLNSFITGAKPFDITELTVIH